MTYSQFKALGIKEGNVLTVTFTDNTVKGGRAGNVALCTEDNPVLLIQFESEYKPVPLSDIESIEIHR